MKLNIRLFINTRQINTSEKCPIRCRFTYEKKRKEFSTGLFINPKHWNAKKQKLLEDAESFDYINTQLSLIINKLNQAFLLLQVQPNGFNVDDIFAIYRGDKIKRDYQVVQYFEVFLEHLKRLVGVDLEQST